MDITQLHPREVFQFFSEISKIPHGSGNTAALAAYCLDFAQKRGLRAVRDAGGNVVIYKDASAGFEASPTVILQGHLDMVCEKNPDNRIDMEKEAITLCCDDEFVWADGTTLGGDDGIAVAYMLALLDSESIPHPPIEALFTNDEEVGMLGARAFDASLLRGRRLINIDSETEGILTVSCAGGVRAMCEIPLHFEGCTQADSAFRIFLSGLKGGHSGTDINAHRRNAHIVMGRILQHIARTTPFNIAHLSGGTKANAIPQTAEAVICTRAADFSQIAASVQQFETFLRDALARTEPDVTITVEECAAPAQMICSDDTQKLIFALQQIPNGILAMSPDIPDMVQTSLNAGILTMTESSLKLGYLIRSNASSGKQLAVQKLVSFMEYIGAHVEFMSDYPMWEYRVDSSLRDIMVSAYEELYDEKPVVAAIHAGLECGILSGKIPDMDMVSFGPDLENVHTANERMRIASVSRCWQYLLKVLEMCR